jgi:hypothetical protein
VSDLKNALAVVLLAEIRAVTSSGYYDFNAGGGGGTVLEGEGASVGRGGRGEGVLLERDAVPKNVGDGNELVCWRRCDVGLGRCRGEERKSVVVGCWRKRSVVLVVVGGSEDGLLGE